MSKLVIIDSQIFIWGIKGYATSGQEHRIKQAKALLDDLAIHKYNILMPTPMMAELLSFEVEPRREEIRAFIHRNFQIAPFDELAAMKFGELMNKTLNDKDLRQYCDDAKVYKARMKFDCMICAIGITRGVKRIYSDDTHLKRFAHNQVPVLNIDHIAVQLDIIPKATRQAEPPNDEDEN